MLCILGEWHEKQYFRTLLLYELYATHSALLAKQNKMVYREQDICLINSFLFFFILFYYLECRIKIFLMISDVRSAIAPSICDCMWTYCKSKFRIKVNYKFVYIMLMLWVFRIDKGNINFILIKRTNCMCKNILKRKWHHSFWLLTIWK